jgi:hypothetical protein
MQNNNERSRPAEESGALRSLVLLGVTVFAILNTARKQAFSKPMPRKWFKTPEFWIPTTIALVSAGVAIWQVGVAEKALTSVQRAFVYMQPNGVTPIKDSAGNAKWIWRTQIGNSGTTATRRMEYSLNCTEERSKLFASELITEKRVASHAIGPQVKDNALEGCVRTDEEMQKIIDDQKDLFLFGRAIYQDIFQTDNTVDLTRFIRGKNHVTEFCIHLSEIARKPDTDTKNLDQFYARAKHCGEHNCIDDECQKRP